LSLVPEKRKKATREELVVAELRQLRRQCENLESLIRSWVQQPTTAA
jgi:hypothetical protein